VSGGYVLATVRSAESSVSGIGSIGPGSSRYFSQRLRARAPRAGRAGAWRDAQVRFDRMARAVQTRSRAGRTIALMEMEMVTEIDLASWEPGYTADPYPFLARLRAEAPVARVLIHGVHAWLVTRYEDIRDGLSDPRLSNDPTLADEATRAVPWVGASVATARHMLRVDPPDHTRMRGLVAKAFTPRRIEGLRPRIQDIADELVAEIAPRGRADLLAEFALPLPLTVISEVLAVPPDERTAFVQWTNVFFGVDEGDAARLIEARQWINHYLERLIQRRMRDHATGVADPEHGTLLDGLIAARDAGDRLSSDELLAMAFLLLVAGYDTTVNLIGNGLASLLRHRDQYEALRADPSLIRPAIEELLRHEPPVKIAPFVRVATTPVTLGGVTILPGQPILFALAAANRDPARFTDPDSLDITRAERAHLAFGYGVHFCLGAPLARLEAEIAFTTLLARCPDLELAVAPDDLAWRTSRVLRGLTHLPVTFRAQAAMATTT
jgi:cytochrome P450